MYVLLSILSTLRQHLVFIQYLLFSEEIQLHLCIDNTFLETQPAAFDVVYDAYGENSSLIELVL